MDFIAALPDWLGWLATGAAVFAVLIFALTTIANVLQAVLDAS